MKTKIGIGAFIILVLGIYAFVQANNKSATTASTLPTNNSSVMTASNSSTTSTTTPSTTTYKDGTYTGKSSDAVYGYIQVKATISGGKLTDVTFLDYPQDRHDSVEINDRAMPTLKSEAIAANSAQVDGVSGATDTSQAFEQSLGDALSQAAV